jgi:hypothetical protein
LNNLTQNEKDIYNCFLKHFRNGLPYQPRKDFSDINPSVGVQLRRLSSFFSKFPHISYNDFFGAPTALHPDEKCPPLNFFTTRPAIKAYSLSMKKQEDESPEKQIDKIKESFHFIAMFCLKNGIDLDQYLNHKTKNMPTWMQHYREHNVNPYALLGLGDLNRFKPSNEEERYFWAGDFFDRIDAYRSRFFANEKTKTFVKEAIVKIKNFIKKELHSK